MPTDSGTLAAFEFVLGDRSLALGTSRGDLSIWSLAPVEPGYGASDGVALRRLHEFERFESPIVRLASAPTRRSIYVGLADGRLSVAYPTNERVRGRDTRRSRAARGDRAGVEGRRAARRRARVWATRPSTSTTRIRRPTRARSSARCTTRATTARRTSYQSSSAHRRVGAEALADAARLRHAEGRLLRDDLRAAARAPRRALHVAVHAPEGARVRQAGHRGDGEPAERRARLPRGARHRAGGRRGRARRLRDVLRRRSWPRSSRASGGRRSPSRRGRRCRRACACCSPRLLVVAVAALAVGSADSVQRALFSGPANPTGDFRVWLTGAPRPGDGLPLLRVALAVLGGVLGFVFVPRVLPARPAVGRGALARPDRGLGRRAGGARSRSLAPLVDHLVFDDSFRWFLVGKEGGKGTVFDVRNSLVVGIAMGFAVIPVVYTIAEDALSSIPDSLRSAALGCGASPWQTAIRVVVPAAVPGHLLRRHDRARARRRRDDDRAHGDGRHGDHRRLDLQRLPDALRQHRDRAARGAGRAARSTASSSSPPCCSSRSRSSSTRSPRWSGSASARSSGGSDHGRRRSRASPPARAVPLRTALPRRTSLGMGHPVRSRRCCSSSSSASSASSSSRACAPSGPRGSSRFTLTDGTRHHGRGDPAADRPRRGGGARGGGPDPDRESRPRGQRRLHLRAGLADPVDRPSRGPPRLRARRARPGLRAREGGLRGRHGRRGGRRGARGAARPDGGGRRAPRGAARDPEGAARPTPARALEELRIQRRKAQATLEPGRPRARAARPKEFDVARGATSRPARASSPGGSARSRRRTGGFTVLLAWGNGEAVPEGEADLVDPARRRGQPARLLRTVRAVRRAASGGSSATSPARRTPTAASGRRSSARCS